MEIKEIINQSSCICTAFLNTEEIYIMVFEYKTNPFQQTLERANDSFLAFSSDKNMHIKTSLFLDKEIQITNKTVIHDMIKKKLTNLLIFVVNNITKEVFLKYYKEDDFLQKELEIVGLLVNQPSVIEDLLKSEDKVSFKNFEIGMTENGKFFHYF